MGTGWKPLRNQPGINLSTRKAPKDPTGAPSPRYIQGGNWIENDRNKGVTYGKMTSWFPLWLRFTRGWGTPAARPTANTNVDSQQALTASERFSLDQAQRESLTNFGTCSVGLALLESMHGPMMTYVSSDMATTCYN